VSPACLVRTPGLGITAESGGAAMAGILSQEGWSVEAVQRWEKLEAEKQAHKAFRARCEAHPLANVLEGVSDASRAASEATRWRMLARDFGNGHKECVLMREIPDLSKDLERSIERDCGGGIRGEARDPEESKRSSVRRASCKLRLKAKAAGFNSLHTLTTATPVLDRSEMWGLLSQFVRRVRAVLGEYRYAAIIEPQERGALHVHIASHALPARIILSQAGHRVPVKSWDVMRAIWRSVVGTRRGNFDEAKRGKRWGKGLRAVRGAHAIAAYLAGYIAKDFAAVDFNRKRYATSKDIEVPEPYRATWQTADSSLVGLVELAYAAVGENIVSRWFDAGRGVLFLASDDSRDGVRWRKLSDQAGAVSV
jgi:hypothetical protein